MRQIRIFQSLDICVSMQNWIKMKHQDTFLHQSCIKRCYGHCDRRMESSNIFSSDKTISEDWFIDFNGMSTYLGLFYA